MLVPKMTTRATTALSSSASATLMGDTNEMVEQPYLNPIPSGLFPEYRPLPLLSNVPLLLLAAILGSGGLRRFSTILNPPCFLPLIQAASRTFAVYASSYMALQEAFARFRPSRISVSELQARYQLLPSSLSRYERLTSDGPRVHWIQCSGGTSDVTKNAAEDTPALDAAVLFHGFGANCLSWLPSCVPLARALRIGTCVAPDAPGFGLTERSGGDFSMDGSATLGTDVLLSTTPRPRSVLLIGHSLGTGATLRMALQLQDMPEVETVHVVLVSPVLGRHSTSSKGEEVSAAFPPTRRRPQRRRNPILTLLGPILRFLLRRTVGRPGFWRNGLQQAFVQPLTDADVTRYQWPSIVRGWEDGLLQWIFAQSAPRNGSELLTRVSASTKVASVLAVLGEQDRLIRPDTSAMFLAAYHPTVQVVTIDGVGHDPMEEKVETFVKAVQDSVASGRSTSSSSMTS